MTTSARARGLRGAGSGGAVRRSGRAGVATALALAAAALVAPSCRGDGSLARGAGAPVLGCRIVRAYPHDPAAFTQGLIYRDGSLYESTGLAGRSTVRKVKLETGEALLSRALAPRYFGEGLAAVGDTLVQLTWTSGTAFLWDADSLRALGSFPYEGEGWGLTRGPDGRLVMSDGSGTLRLLDPRTFRETGKLLVMDAGRPVEALNELELVGKDIYANVWHADRIAVISPGTGRVTAWIDVSGPRAAADAAGPEQVANGIAWDPRGGRLFVTGKNWSKVFEIEVVPAGPAAGR